MEQLKSREADTEYLGTSLPARRDGLSFHRMIQSVTLEQRPRIRSPPTPRTISSPLKPKRVPITTPTYESSTIPTMFAQRQVLRALRSPAVQRRFASTAPRPGETAFAAERRAVKEHAASSTGMCCPCAGAVGRRKRETANADCEHSALEEDLYLV